MYISLNINQIKTYSGKVVAAEAQMDVTASVDDGLDLDMLREFRNDVQEYINRKLSKVINGDGV